MANGSTIHPRSSGLFSGLLLIGIGILMLMWTYAHIGLGSILRHWWPLIFIVWGLVKFYERTVAQREGKTSGWITAGEIFLVVGVFCMVGVVIIVDLVRQKIDSRGGIERIGRGWGDDYSFDLDSHSQPIPPNARVQINIPRGDITVHTGDEQEIVVNGKKKVKSWNEQTAQRIAESAKLEVVKDGDSYVVRPAGSAADDGNFGFDLDLGVPKKASMDVKNTFGDIHLSDISNNVNVSVRKGDVEVSDTGGNVNVETQ